MKKKKSREPLFLIELRHFYYGWLEEVIPAVEFRGSYVVDTNGRRRYINQALYTVKVIPIKKEVFDE